MNSYSDLKVEITRCEVLMLVGVRVNTTLTTDRPHTYWQPFKQRLKEIPNAITDRFYSVQIMTHPISLFTPETNFEKWAAVAVSRQGSVPDGMESLVIPEGSYAVCVHVGLPSAFLFTMKFIFDDWLPKSKFEVDDRPHFQVMKQDYRPNDPKAEELVYIPIKPKS